MSSRETLQTRADLPTDQKQTHRLEEVGMAADHQEIAHVRLSQQILELLADTHAG